MVCGSLHYATTRAARTDSLWHKHTEAEQAESSGNYRPIERISCDVNSCTDKPDKPAGLATHSLTHALIHRPQCCVVAMVMQTRLKLKAGAVKLYPARWPLESGLSRSVYLLCLSIKSPTCWLCVDTFQSSLLFVFVHMKFELTHKLLSVSTKVRSGYLNLMFSAKLYFTASNKPNSFVYINQADDNN